ncbi:hypothetical protein [Paenibacillus bouchesdurhonensis]|uniref:hypothetical protein n=1 Tax=Paenibacillus bouchesdurhonensis TaxID=1870990 RepID=UPI000DA5F9F0|nr:hypothetical protein [Paenibacillus bouchesdurhonensis]
MIVYMGYEDKAWVYSDTRVSAKLEGVDYYIRDGFDKARAYGDKVVMVMGSLPMAEQIFYDIDFSDYQLDTIVSITSKVYKEHNQGEIGVYVLALDDNDKYVIHTISNLNDFAIETEVITNNVIGAAGANSDKALQHISEQLKAGIPRHEAIKSAYQHVADEKVGGDCILHQLDNTKEFTLIINRYKTYEIFDENPLRKFSEMAAMDGTAKFKKLILTDGNNTALLNSETRKFHLNNWDIEGVGSLDAQFIQASALTAEDGFINDLTVNALKTLDKTDTVGSKIDYVQAKDNFLKLVTGTITNRIHAQNSNGELLYWTDANKTNLTTSPTPYPFYDLTYNPIDKFKLYLEGAGDTSYPRMILGVGDGVTELSGKAIIEKPTGKLNISYHKSNTGTVREVTLDDMGITIRANNDGTVTIEGQNIKVTATNKITLDATNGYDFA